MIGQIAEYAVLAGFLLITVASIVNSSHRGNKFLARHVGRLVRVVPKYNFFAPRPAQTDCFLVF